MIFFSSNRFWHFVQNVSFLFIYLFIYFWFILVHVIISYKMCLNVLTCPVSNPVSWGENSICYPRIFFFFFFFGSPVGSNVWIFKQAVLSKLFSAKFEGNCSVIL